MSLVLIASLWGVSPNDLLTARDYNRESFYSMRMSYSVSYSNSEAFRSHKTKRLDISIKKWNEYSEEEKEKNAVASWMTIEKCRRNAMPVSFTVGRSLISSPMGIEFRMSPRDKEELVKWEANPSFIGVPTPGEKVDPLIPGNVSIPAITNPPTTRRRVPDANEPYKDDYCLPLYIEGGGLTGELPDLEQRVFAALRENPECGYVLSGGPESTDRIRVSVRTDPEHLVIGEYSLAQGGLPHWLAEWRFDIDDPMDYRETDHWYNLALKVLSDGQLQLEPDHVFLTRLCTYSEFTEVVPEGWYPKRQEVMEVDSSFPVDKKDNRTYLFSTAWKTSIDVSEIGANEVYTPDTFAPDPALDEKDEVAINSQVLRNLRRRLEEMPPNLPRKEDDADRKQNWNELKILASLVKIVLFSALAVAVIRKRSQSKSDQVS